MPLSLNDCRNSKGQPKERYSSARSAKASLEAKRKFRAKRWPHAYECGCGSWHVGSLARETLAEHRAKRVDPYERHAKHRKVWA